jgi:hypothetical protein
MAKIERVLPTAMGRHDGGWLSALIRVFDVVAIHRVSRASYADDNGGAAVDRPFSINAGGAVIG